MRMRSEKCPNDPLNLPKKWTFHPLIGNRGRRKLWWRQIFDRK